MKTRILFEDNSIIICHKPAGLATQSAHVSRSDAESELRNYVGGSELYLIHRLDQPVEGILVFAKNRKAAGELGRQVQDGRMKKTYRALVCGNVEPKEAVLVDYLMKLKNGLGQAVSEEQMKLPQFRDAKRAELSYRTLQYNSDMNVTKIEIDLKTGRFHQIRLQMSHAGFPLAGDLKYGGALAKETASRLMLRHIALAAYKLEMEHPLTQEIMSFEIVPAFEQICCRQPK